MINMLEAVQVMAMWQPEGRFLPRVFTWQDKVYTVEETGRAWEDETGLHILCMAAGGTIFELVFCLQPAGWRLRPPNPVGLA